MLFVLYILIKSWIYPSKIFFPDLLWNYIWSKILNFIKSNFIKEEGKIKIWKSHEQESDPRLAMVEDESLVNAARQWVLSPVLPLRNGRQWSLLEHYLWPWIDRYTYIDKVLKRFSMKEFKIRFLSMSHGVQDSYLCHMESISPKIYVLRHELKDKNGKSSIYLC